MEVLQQGFPRFSAVCFLEKISGFTLLYMSDFLAVPSFFGGYFIKILKIILNKVFHFNKTACIFVVYCLII